MVEHAKWKALAHLVEIHQVSQRQACSALDVDRSTVRYKSRRSDDTDLRDAMKAVAQERRRFGYPLPGRALRSNVPRGAAACDGRTAGLAPSR
jgi:hypothetical protein